MDNMLYILAVLVIILLLAVLVMRRRQARNLTFLGDSRKIKNDRSYKGFSSLETKTLNNESIATKFDNVTIAERFMDQQRYDKAIETLKRGLIEKPHDGSLLLKLLNVYVVANQYQDFDRVYHTLQAHGDPETIEQAEQLKELISDRHTTSFEDSFSDDIALDDSASIDSTGDHATANPFFDEGLSLDFDSDQTFGDSRPAEADVKFDHHDSSNDSFNLTLDDLEATETSNDIPEDLDAVEDNDLSNIDIDEAGLSTSSNNAAHIDDDFTLDFETVTEKETEDLLADDHSTDLSANGDSEALDLAGDFTLDLEDYAAVLRSDALGEDQSVIEHDIDEQDINELSIDEFSFDLEDSGNNFDDIASPVSNDAISDIDINSHVISNDDTAIVDSDDSSLDDERTFDFTVADKPDNDESDTDKPINDDVAIDTPSTIDTLGALSPAIDAEKPADNELLDDDTMFDDLSFDDLVFDDNNGLDVEAVTDSSSPVSTQKIILTNNLAPVTLGTILTSDFDYVKTLNSHQVTLELADHYLQLGEYDSAKRLLTEVITQGNSEQQQKAKMLLARTA